MFHNQELPLQAFLFISTTEANYDIVCAVG